MISVCIPLYNNLLHPLLEQLEKSTKKCTCAVEILILDDAGNPEITAKNLIRCQNIESVNYLVNKKNLGRAATRNKLAAMAQYENLLFMDADSEICNVEFLERYQRSMSQVKVVCGGTAYFPVCQDKEKSLRHRYGLKREMLTAAQRNKNPNQSFSTFNFCIKKNIFEQVKFDESLREYGHEDTLFGYALNSAGYRIHHIDNVLIHNGIESNTEFLDKSQKAVANLATLIKNGKMTPELLQSNKLFVTFARVKQSYFLMPVKFMLFIISPIINKNLLSSRPSIRLFDLWKLNKFINYMQHN